MTQDYWEPGPAPKVGDRVRVRLSPECPFYDRRPEQRRWPADGHGAAGPHHHGMMGRVRDTQALSSLGHLFVVALDDGGWGNFAAVELELIQEQEVSP